MALLDLLGGKLTDHEREIALRYRATYRALNDAQAALSKARTGEWLYDGPQGAAHTPELFADRIVWSDIEVPLGKDLSIRIDELKHPICHPDPDSEDDDDEIAYWLRLRVGNPAFEDAWFLEHFQACDGSALERFEQRANPAVSGAEAAASKRGEQILVATDQAQDARKDYVTARMPVMDFTRRKRLAVGLWARMPSPQGRARALLPIQPAEPRRRADALH